MYSACSYVPMHVLVHHECTCQVAIGLRTEWGRSGSAVECRTLDRENPVMNPLHMMAPLMATRGDNKTKSLYLAINCDCFTSVGNDCRIMDYIPHSLEN